MNIDKLIEVLEIFRKYSDDNSLSIDTAHDEIYFYHDKDDVEMSDEDTKRMKELGWNEDIEEGWMHFV